MAVAHTCTQQRVRAVCRILNDMRIPSFCQPVPLRTPRVCATGPSQVPHLRRRLWAGSLRALEPRARKEPGRNRENADVQKHNLLIVTVIDYISFLIECFFIQETVLVRHIIFMPLKFLLHLTFISLWNMRWFNLCSE